MWNFPVVFGPIIARFFNVPYIITPHGTLYKETFEGKSAIIKKLHYWLFVKKNLQHANAVHFTTKDEKEKVEDFLNLKINSTVIPYGMEFMDVELDLDFYKDKFHISKDKKVILFLGRINWKKGLDILLKGFEEYLKEKNDYILVS